MSDVKELRVGLSRAEQFVVRIFVARVRPAAAAGLQQPEPADVLEQARRAADAAFIGEIEFERARAS